MATYTAREGDNGKTYTLVAANRDVVRVDLEEGGFVGYSWTVTAAPDGAVINFADQGVTYTGSLGHHVWTCEAIGTGTTRLEMSRRPDGLIYTLNFVVV